MDEPIANIGPNAPIDPLDEALMGLGDGSWVEHARRATGDDTPLGSLGAYQLLEVVGRGGQGEVYKAVQPGTGRVVALKRLSLIGRGMGAQAAARFVREIDAVTRLSHPNVVPVYAAEVIAGHPVLVMEFVEGVTIDRWADERWGRGGDAVWAVLGQFACVCEGVTHAHQRGVIHRDLKPANVLVGTDGRPRVVDFGVAVVTDRDDPAEATAFTTFAGTPSYASPEQLRGDRDGIDVRSDVYSLGALLHRMTTGVEAFGGGVPGAGERPPPPRASRLRRGLSPELDWIILRALEPLPDRRYQSVADLREDVLRLSRGEAVSAHPPSFLYRSRKFLRRYRVGVGAATLVAVALAAASGVSIRSAVVTERALRDAEAAAASESAAKESAQRAEARALTEARAQREVTTFLHGVLSASTPLKAPGKPEISVRDALDRASAKLDDGEMELEPAVESAVRLAIGETYASLGRIRDAQPHLERSFELRKLAFGATSDEALSSAHHLGRLYRALGEDGPAEAMQREVVRLRRELSGPDSLFLAQALVSLGIVLREQGLLEEAEAAHRQARAIYVSHLGEQNDNVAICDNNIALVLLDRGQADEAEEGARRAIEVAMSLPDVPQQELARFRLSRGVALWKLGRQPEGEAEIAAAIELDRSLQGPAAHGCTSAELGYAKFLAEIMHPDAVESLRTAIDCLLRQHPGDSPRVRRLEAQLALLLCRLERADEAEAVCLASLARCDDGAIARALTRRLALARAQQGRFAEAEAGLESSAAQAADRVERREASQQLAELYELWHQAEPNAGHDAAAARWRAELADPADR